MRPAVVMQQPFGRYQLLVALARGGMAELFLARLLGVGGFAKLVVIKRMLPHLSEDPAFVEMFLNEGRIAARLAHPNVCQVYELGEVDGQLFLAMEYLDGLPWDHLIRVAPKGGGFELRLAAGILAQACDGLHYAHQLRDATGAITPVVHRDVSPQNLFVTTDGVCKLLDFGVSKVLTEGPRTRTGMIKGKLPYMAPEQIRGEAVDARADVFSVGVVLWEALTRERLFQRDSDYQIWRAVTEEPIRAVTEVVADLPPAIDAVVGKALERDPARRYASVRLLAQDLRRVAETVGGGLEPAEIAEAMTSFAAAQLAERMTVIGKATSGAQDLVPTVVAKPAAAEADAGVSDPGSTMASVMLRDGSVAIGRSRRRKTWPIAVAALIVAAAAVVTMVVVAPGATTTRTAGTGTGTVTGTETVAGTGTVTGTGTVAATETEAAAGTGSAPAPGSGSGSGSDSDLGSRISTPSDPKHAHHRDRTPPPPMTAGAPPPPAAPAATEPGVYSVDSKPYATIYIDGTSRGDTPLFRVALPPGKHQVKAVRADGVVKTFSISIESGKSTSSGRLAW